MAEKVTLFELNIDTKALVKANAEVKKSVDELTKGVKELKKEEQENNKAIEEAKKKLKALKDERVRDTQEIKKTEKELDKLIDTRTELNQKLIDNQTVLKANQNELRQNNKLITDSIQANNLQTGSIAQLRKQLSVVSVEWAKLSKAERENTKRGQELTKQKKQLTEQLKKEEKATGDTRRNVGNYNEGIQQALGITSNLSPALGSAAIAVKTFGKAFKLALGPIGLIIAALAAAGKAIQTFFTNSEEGQDEWDQFTASLSVTTGNIADAFADLGKKILNPAESIRELRDFFDRVFVQYWEGALEFISASWDKVWLGAEERWLQFLDLFSDQEQALKDIRKEIKQNEIENLKSAVKIVKAQEEAKEAYDDLKDTIGEKIAENEREIEIEKNLRAQEAQLNKQRRAILIQNAKLEKEIALGRIEIEKTNQFTAEERLQILDDVLKKEEQILDNNLSIATIERNIIVQRNKLSGSRREDLDKEAAAIAKVEQVETASINGRRRLETRRVAFLKELNKEKVANELQTAKELEDFAAEEAAQAVKDLKNQLALEASLQAQAAEQEKDARQRALTDRENELAIAEGNVVRQLQIQRDGLEAQRAQEVEFAQSIGADVLLINEKFSKAKQALDRAEFQAKAELAAGFAGDIAKIAGEQTAIGKAAAVAETSINTYKSATASYSALAGIPVVGPVLGAAAAGAAIAAGLKNVQEILKVDSGLPGDTAGGAVGVSGAGVPNVSSPQIQAPQVNEGIISRETIAQETQEPQTIVAIPTDGVTIKQQQAAANNNTSVL